MKVAAEAIENAGASADLDQLARSFDETRATHQRAQRALERQESLDDARALAAPDSRGTDARVTNEPLTYERYAPNSFFRDLAESKQGDTGATGRLNRHMHEVAVEKRAINSSAGTGGEFSAPLWLQDEWVAVQRAGRPVANTLNLKPLPPGTQSINLPKVTTGTAVAVQTDGGSVQATDLATGSVTAAVQTIAGQQDGSMQLLDLSQPGIDEVIFDDLARAYATKLDQLVISGTVTNAKGLDAVSGINSVTFTSATPTVPLIYPKVADAVQQIHTGRFLPPQVVAVHPRRWAWFLASLDSQNRPLVVPNGPGVNQVGVLSEVASENVVGTLHGLPVVVDANIPVTLGASTSEDELLIYRADDIYLWESEPRFRILEEVLSNTLQFRAQAYGYYALAAGRLPKAISKIGGTGCVAPSF